MTTTMQKSQSEIWAREAMERLERDGVVPIPDNFAVYYAYASGANTSLKMAMDAITEQYGKLNQQHCSELYQAFLSLEAEHRVLNTTTSSIETELNRVMGVISRNASTSAEYGEKLDYFSGSLQASLSYEQVRAAVERVTNETRVMAEQNIRLQEQLAESTQQLTEVRYNLDQVRKESLIDPLTEVGNRKFFSYELGRVAAEAIESGNRLSMLMVDIDHFKKFNDIHGHLIGDQVLRLVAHTLIENLKGRDIIARYGGEEFVILLPNTGVKDAERVGDQLRSNLATKQLRRKNTNETLGVITISIGCAEYCPHEDTDAFIARADEAMYEAKNSGRNRVMSKLLPPEEVAVITAKAV